MSEDTKDCTRLPVVAWQVEFPLGNGAKVYEQRPSWAYESYGDLAYVTHELCRLTDAQALIAELRAEVERLSDTNARIADEQARNLDYKSAWLEVSALADQWAEKNARLLAQLQAAPAERGIVLPDKFQMEPFQTVDRGSTDYKAGWNGYANKFARLNPAPATADHIPDAGKMVEPARNQCDGCQAGIPLENGSHRMGKPGGYSDRMSCTAHMYSATATADSDVREVKK